ncbi:cytochrome c biogenesis protein ResB [Dermacoccaceae bacterium W4C1]
MGASKDAGTDLPEQAPDTDKSQKPASSSASSAKGSKRKNAQKAKKKPKPKQAPAPKLGVWGMARWFWRQLTSMRTALFLLLLLAIAAVPGSIWPQRGVDASRVADYLDRHPDLGEWLDRFSFFDVYSSPWFSAIYLLLVISLLGCIIPRTKQQWQGARKQPPAAPRRLQRLPVHTSAEVEGDAEAVLADARDALRAKRFRLRDGDGWVSGEVGAGREAGNLVFHISLVVLIVSVAAGHLFGWRGDVIVPEGESFSSTASRYDTLNPGPWADVNDLPPWSLRMDKLSVDFEDQVPQSSPQYGQPRSFTADVTTQALQGASKKQKISVNHPIDESGASVYLLGNGYAPKVTVRNAAGEVLYSQATPFLPQDNVYKSIGAVKVTGASPQQLGFVGFFIPSLDFTQAEGPISTFPGLKNPALVLTLYKGNLFPQGQPQSVYTLDTREMTQVNDSDGQPLSIVVPPGRTVELPDGLGSITLERDVPRWAGLSVRSDPGKMPALFAAIIGLIGLVVSLVLRRRRVFVRVEPVDGEQGRTLVRVGALSKNDDPRLEGAVEDLLRSIVDRTGRRT